MFWYDQDLSCSLWNGVRLQFSLWTGNETLEKGWSKGWSGVEARTLAIMGGHSGEVLTGGPESWDVPWIVRDLTAFLSTLNKSVSAQNRRALCFILLWCSSHRSSNKHVGERTWHKTAIQHRRSQDPDKAWDSSPFTGPACQQSMFFTTYSNTKVAFSFGQWNTSNQQGSRLCQYEQAWTDDAAHCTVSSKRPRVPREVEGQTHEFHLGDMSSCPLWNQVSPVISWT